MGVLVSCSQQLSKLGAVTRVSSMENISTERLRDLLKVTQEVVELEFEPLKDLHP